MSILGYKNRVDPDYQKTCLEKWIEYGAAKRAAADMGITTVSLQYNAWRWVLEHPDEARPYIDKAGVNDKRYPNGITDDDYYALLVSRAMTNYKSIKHFESFIVMNKIWEYPDAYDLFKIKYPTIHQRYSDRVQR